jgi:hypothetical protein
MFYLPLFYMVEAVAFEPVGVNQFVAHAVVSLFAVLLVGSAYVLARFFRHWSAVVIGTPETAFWARNLESGSGLQGALPLRGWIVGCSISGIGPANLQLLQFVS